MSEKIKYTFKELRKPDKFRELLANAIDNASNHFNKILIATAAIILVLIIFYVVSSVNKKKDISANIEFEEALKTYNNGEILESLDKFGEVNKKYSGRKISSLALYYIGIINYDLEEYHITIDNLKEFLNNKIEDEIIKESAILTIGLSYFNLKDWEESINYLSKINDSTSPYYDQSRLHLGMSYEKSGNFEKSEEIYKEILSKRTNRPIGQ